MEFKPIDKVLTATETTTTILPFRDQDFDKLKQECLRSNKLFEDPVFPATGKSIAYSHTPETRIWKRPSEIVKDPKFIKDGFVPGDIDQGYLGNCWFLAACGSLTLQKDVFARVVPVDQELYGPNYCGILHFRFWIAGQWYDVVIDDRLPMDPSGRRLLFCANKDEPKEFWSALLEKAYAKANLSYENLDGGFINDALVDMSGGIQETYMVKEMRTQSQRNLLWNVLVRSKAKKSMIGCAINADPNIREARLPNGLVMGHAYTLQRVEVITVQGKEVRLMRIRNPWGNEIEWRGPWSDSSTEWNLLSTEQKTALGYLKLPDGEYYMSFDDFCKTYDTIDICSLTPCGYGEELIEPNSGNLPWKLTSYNGRWVPGESAGGSGNEGLRLFWKNPQFLVTLQDVDKDDNENLATVIISLLQKNTPEKRMRKNGQYAEEAIQFRLYRVTNPADANRVRTTGTRLYANQLELVGSTGMYTEMREVTKRFRVSPGDYLIIPSTFYKDTDCEFLLRLFTEEEIRQSFATVLCKHKEHLEDSEIQHVKTITPLFELDSTHPHYHADTLLDKYSKKDITRRERFYYKVGECCK